MLFKDNNPHRLFLVNLFVYGSLLLSCSSGKTVINSVSYYAVPSEENVNYYKVTIAAKGTLSKYNYASGWYPTNSLDQLFGKVSDEESAEGIAIQKAIRKQYNDAILVLNKRWLDSASDINTPTEQLTKLMNARRRILAYPAPGIAPFENSIEVEYNPEKGMALLHSDEKFVVIVSANPNEVVGKISSFSESDKTTAQINKLSQFFLLQSKAELTEQQAEQDVNSEMSKEMLVPQLKLLKSTIDGEPTKEQAITQINVLVELLRNF